MRRWLVAGVSFLQALSLCHADFFNLPGTFNYALYSDRDVLAVSCDGSIGLALTTGSQLTTFDPNSGQQFDSQNTGFGPQGVRLINIGDQLRAVVLTDEGGPTTITIFDVSPSGALTQRARKKLTDSFIDFRSNLALSPTGVGFVLVSSDGASEQLMAFSLDDGSILGAFPTTAAFASLALLEANGKRTLAFVRLPSTYEAWLVVTDATDPTNMQEIGEVLLPRNTSLSASPHVEFEFTSDGRYAFVANTFIDFAVIDLANMSVATSLSGVAANYLKMVERETDRLLAIMVWKDQAQHIMLADATDPTQLAIVNDRVIGGDGRSYPVFTRVGDRVVVATRTSLIALDVPLLDTIWQHDVPNAESIARQSAIYGDPESAIGAWGISTAILGSFPVYEPHSVGGQ